MCLAASLLAWGTAEAVQSSKSAWSGVYTVEQAARGEKLYFDRCSMCHGDDLGGRERAPALAGSQFLDAWHGKTLKRLLDRIGTMPPGGTPPAAGEAIDLLAYLLSASELPSGAALPSDPALLADITIERTKP